MAEQCAPGVAPDTLGRIASVESSFNPYAIGVVGGRLARQPASKAEAVATANMLAAAGYDYSVGLVQVNQKHFPGFGLTPETAFDPCVNLRIGSAIFQDCYKRAGGSLNPLGDALSCYYSGNFKTGYRLGYVTRVLSAGGTSGSPTVPAIPVVPDRPRARAQSRPAPKKPPSTGVLFVSSPPLETKIAESAPKPSSSTNGPATALLF